MTAECSSSNAMTPRFGVIVVNGIGADLRARLGQRRQQRRLAGVRRAHQADVGDELQLELDPALLAGRALLGVRRGAMGGRREVDVAAAAAAAAATTRRVSASSSSPTQSPVGVRADDGAGRHADDDVRGVPAMRPASRCRGRPRRGAEVDLALEVAERGHAGVDDEDDAAALAAVAAVGAAARHVRLAPEGRRAVAAGTAGHHDPSAISEHGAEHSNAGDERRRWGSAWRSVGAARLEVALRVVDDAVHDHLEVNVRPGADAGAADGADPLARRRRTRPS